jgi:UDP-N-acetylglucosamine 2-epimerase (non-hydrolysing)
VGANVIAGVDPQTIVNAAEIMMEKPRSWKNPFGNGKAGDQIIRILNS